MITGHAASYNIISIATPYDILIITIDIINVININIVYLLLLDVNDEDELLLDEDDDEQQQQQK